MAQIRKNAANAPKFYGAPKLNYGS